MGSFRGCFANISASVITAVNIDRWQGRGQTKLGGVLVANGVELFCLFGLRRGVVLLCHNSDLVIHQHFGHIKPGRKERGSSAPLLRKKLHQLGQGVLQIRETIEHFLCTFFARSSCLGENAIRQNGPVVGVQHIDTVLL